ncbi:MAG: hypothetical protein ACK414_02600 [Gemmobacter sp.]
MSDPSAPTEPPGPTEPPAPHPPVPPEPPTRGFVDRNEPIALFMVAGVSLLLLGAFFHVVVYDTTLLRFPLHDRAVSPGTSFTDALEYRERRTALALMLGSFVTGFGFVVGLALATMGGIFILRQVKALTTLNLSPGTGAADDTTPEGLRSWLKATQFSFQSYSPGGGVHAGRAGRDRHHADHRVAGDDARAFVRRPVPVLGRQGRRLSRVPRYGAGKAEHRGGCRNARAAGRRPPAPTPAPAPETAAAPATLDARCRADAADRPKFCETVNADGVVK